MARAGGAGPRAGGGLALLLRPVTFFGGKGGVGKTTLAAAAAIHSADAGARTLLVSTDPAHSAGDALDVRLGPEPSPVLDRLDALEIDPRAAADRYIEDVKARIREAASPRLLREVEREVDVARVSPGAEEAALFDRFAELMSLAGDADARYDRVIFDTAPTGHTIRLLGLPELMDDWVAGLVARRRKLRSLDRMWRNVAGAAAGGERPGREGAGADPVLDALERRQARFRAARAVVTDPARAGFVFVVLPERLPILETWRAMDALRGYGIPVTGVILNRVLPAAAGGEFLERRRAREARYVEEVDLSFPELPRPRVELREDDVVGVEALRGLAGDLAAAG